MKMHNAKYKRVYKSIQMYYYVKSIFIHYKL